ncbi:MAG: TolC family protein [Hyphomicrobiaceae bacterium]|nr:TolC family protein [Hyphomicrobiaceae bacterium]MCC0023386.1 TolC family protein [Hyphomicrobiaceae bacterium]
MKYGLPSSGPLLAGAMRTAVAAAVLVALAGCASNRTAPPLSYGNPAQQSVISNPALLAAGERINQAQSGEVIAAADMLPDVSLSANATAYVTDDLTPVARTDSAELALGISLPVIRSLAAVRGLKAAQLNTAAEKAAFEAEKADLILEIVTAIAELDRARRVAELRSEAFSNLRSFYTDQRRLLQTGTISATDLQQIQARIAQAEATLLRANADRSAAEAKLASLGLSPSQQFQLVDAASHLPSNEAETLALAKASNPKIREAGLRHQSAEQNIAVTAASLGPDLNVSLNMGTNRTDYLGGAAVTNQNVNLGFGLNVPLFDGGSRVSQLKQEQSHVRELDYESHALSQSVDADTRANWYKFQAARGALELAQRRADIARAALSGISEARRIGAKSIQEELAAMDDVTEARVAYANTKYDIVTTGHKLLALTGRISDAYGLNE